MSDKFQPLNMAQLAKWIFNELDAKNSIFGIPAELFFRPNPSDPFRTTLYGQKLDTPFGVAAGPHSQMAQNIIVAWLYGGRFMELKTIQTLDELEISKPCIDMQDEGYNVEWSQELKIEQSFNEYLMAWVLIHALNHRLGFFGNNPGMIFNMSVGYNLEGILKDNVQWFLKRMDNAGEDLEAAINAVAGVYPSIRDIEIPTRLSDNVTLSTMHGCPPEEIGKIAAYLIEERGLHTNVKLNPTLLGPEMLRGILNDLLEFRQITVPDEAFGHDLKYDDALNILNDLSARAKTKGVDFGVKLSNTLEVVNHRNIFNSKEKMMYMSGRPLQGVTVNLAAKLQREFKGGLAVSYAGGADAFNVADLLASGMNPITTCSDILRPGGYGRLRQYIDETRTSMEQFGAKDIPDYICRRSNVGDDASVTDAILSNLARYSEDVLQGTLYMRDRFDRRATKTSQPLNSFDCIAAPCATTCPIRQDVPGYLNAVAQDNVTEAEQIIRRDNYMGASLGHACNHACENVCVRTHYDEPLAIREIKRFAMEQVEPAEAAYPERRHSVRVAVIGAGPCGLSAAGFLRREGLHVTVFEERSLAGGMVSATLPSYRANPNALRRDIARLAQKGVEFQYNQKAGRDFTVETLLRKGYHYVIIAVGAGLGTPLNLPGEEADGVLDGLAFLRSARDGRTGMLTGRIGIIGAGDVAMDCARVAKRLLSGEGSVEIIYRRTKEEMPAQREEVHELQEEGIPIRELTGLRAVEVNNVKATGLRCIRMALGEPDASGRRRPVEIPGTEFTIPLDYIISAIGQRPHFDFFGGALVALNPKGFIAADPGTLETSMPGVFAGGDAINEGPTTIVKALGDGKRIAAEILRREKAAALSLESVIRADHKLDEVSVLRKRMYREFRVRVQSLPVSQRKTFAEVVQTLDPESAKRESARCLRCDTYCSICTSVCPNRAFFTYETSAYTVDVPKLEVKRGRVAKKKDSETFSVKQAYQTAVLTDFCNECGNCATFCPTSGRPYADKPRFYINEEEFNAQANNAFHFVGTGDDRYIQGRFNGETHTLKPDGSRLIYSRPSLSVTLYAEPLKVGEATTDAADGTEFSLRPAAMLAVLLESVREHQLPPRA